MKLHFSLPFWCTARGVEGAYFQDMRNGSPDFMMKKRVGFPHYPTVMVDTSRRASAATASGKSEVMGKKREELKRPGRLPGPPKPTPLKGNDHRNPALRWSLLILIMELRKNGFEVWESIY
jgi:hypothetical protein